MSTRDQEPLHEPDIEARRRLLRVAAYAAPAVIGTLLTTEARAQPAPSCGPAQPCNPDGPCNPPPCTPRP